MLCLDHLRTRKTGPCFALTVLRCLTHNRAFTLYPPGFVPYGRVAVAPVAPDGSAVVQAVVDAQAFAGTLFDAALDAAQGEAWPRQCEGGTDRWWGRQCRHVDAALSICGVAPTLLAPAREAQAAALDVPTLLLLEHAAAIAAAPGYRSRGRAVRAVLDRVPAGPCPLQRVLAAGHLAGLWGPPLLWEPGIGRLRCLSFRGDGTRPP